MSVSYRDIITLEPGKRSGQPTIRGMRITVADVLSYLAAGMSHEEILSGKSADKARRQVLVEEKLHSNYTCAISTRRSRSAA